MSSFRVVRREFIAGAAFVPLLAGGTGAFSSALPSALPSDSEIKQILNARIEALSAGRDSIGMAAGMVGPARRMIFAGHRDKGNVRPIDGRTVFEIGSVGKVFTALLLAEMVVRGELSLADPAAKYLRTGTKLPERNGRVITLLDLATHTSGLPFMPELPKAENGANYSGADLYRFIERYRLSRDPGSDWDYSNLGYWLLGEALAARGAANIEQLIQRRVLNPLNMMDSGFVLSARMKANLAVGHDASLAPSPSVWTVPVYNLMPAAGIGFVSTTNDLLVLLSAALGLNASALAKALALSFFVRRRVAGSRNVQALGWTLVGDASDSLAFRDGGTFGFGSCIALDRERKTAATVLINGVADVSDICKHLLRQDIALVRPAVSLHQEIALDAAILDRYLGRYEAPGEGIFTVALERGFLTFEAPADWGLPKLRIRPESKTAFFAAELPLRVTVETGADGGATGILIYPPRGQKVITARRMSS